MDRGDDREKKYRPYREGLASDTPKDLSMHTTDKGVFTKLKIDRA